MRAVTACFEGVTHDLHHGVITLSTSLDYMA